MNGTWQAGGIAFDYIEILKEKFGFNYEIVKPPEDSLNADGNGIVGMLSRNVSNYFFLPFRSSDVSNFEINKLRGDRRER